MFCVKLEGAEFGSAPVYFPPQVSLLHSLLIGNRVKAMRVLGLETRSYGLKGSNFRYKCLFHILLVMLFYLK
jgi:hypothetical protein